MTEADCPPAEELASLLEGRSGFRARRKLLAHLNSCEPCFQVFTGAAEFQADFPEYSISAPRKARSPSFLWAAAAAVLLAAAGTGLFFWNASSVDSDRLGVADVVALLPTGGLSDELWPAVLVEFRSGEVLDLNQASFELGVLMVGMAVNAHEGRSDDARRRRELALALLGKIDAAPESRAALGSADPSPFETDDALDRELRSVHYTLGKWAEAGRIAAHQGEADFFTSRPFRHTERLLRSAVLPDEVRMMVTQAGDIIEKGLGDPESLSRLEDVFTRIVLLSSRS